VGYEPGQKKGQQYATEVFEQHDDAHSYRQPHDIADEAVKGNLFLFHAAKIQK
jgi:hypothetical protein